AWRPRRDDAHGSTAPRARGSGGPAARACHDRARGSRVALQPGHCEAVFIAVKSQLAHYPARPIRPVPRILPDIDIPRGGVLMGEMKKFAGVYSREGALDPKTMQLVALAAMAAAGCTS